MPHWVPPSVTTWLTGHDCVAPLAALRAPIPLALCPLRVVKLPPTMTLERAGESTIAATLLSSAFGAQGRRAPLEVAHAASRVRAAPPALKKLPPTYAVVALTASAETCELTAGRNTVSRAPVAVLKAATWLRATPSTVVKSPPT